MSKILVLGGGFGGCTISYLLKQKGFDVTIIEANSFLGGSCRTFFYHGHPYTIGPHHLIIFNDEMHVWDYFSKFVTLRKLNHHTLTYVSQDSRFYTYPIHKDEIEEMPDKDKINEELKNKKEDINPSNLEQYWIESVGKTLYSKFIDNYSKKMWQIDDNTLIDEFSFSPKGVALKTGTKGCFDENGVIAYPENLDAYNTYFDKAVEGCEVILNSEIKKVDLKNKEVFFKDTSLKGDIIISTISLDLLCDFVYGELKYIGRDFLKIILPNKNVFPDPYHFVHYAGDEPYTRIVEYKKLTGYESNDSLIGIEYPSLKNKLYPYPIKKEIEKANKYKEILPKDFYTLGRLGNYRYDNMKIVIKECMALIEKIK